VDLSGALTRAGCSASQANVTPLSWLVGRNRIVELERVGFVWHRTQFFVHVSAENNKAFFSAEFLEKNSSKKRFSPQNKNNH
jgi:hypothetical protein